MHRSAFLLLLLIGCPSTAPTGPSPDDPWYCQEDVTFEDARAVCDAEDDVVIEDCPGFWDSETASWLTPLNPLASDGLAELNPTAGADFIRVGTYSTYEPHRTPWYQDETYCDEGQSPAPPPHDPYWTTEAEWGTPCATASDEATCLASLASVEVTRGFQQDFEISSCTLHRTYLIATAGDSITVIDSVDSIDTWLGELESPEEVALAWDIARDHSFVAAPQGGWIRTGGPGAWHLVEREVRGSLPIVEALTMWTIDAAGRTEGRSVLGEVRCGAVIGR